MTQPSQRVGEERILILATRKENVGDIFQSSVSLDIRIGKFKLRLCAYIGRGVIVFQVEVEC